MNCKIKHYPKHSRGNNFAEPHGKHHIPHCVLHSVCVPQNKRNDCRVCNDCRQRREKISVFEPIHNIFSDEPCSDGAYERCYASADNINDYCAGQCVGENTADKQTRNCGRSEDRQNCQRFRKSDLNDAA